MQKTLLFVALLALGLSALPARGGYLCFPVAGDGSFDTFTTSDGSSVDGYTNGGAGNTARLGYTKQGMGWMAWDAKNSNGVETVSHDSASGMTLAQYVAVSGGQAGTLYLNLRDNILVGSWAIETLRCGNTGVIQEDGGTGTVYTYTNPAPNINGATEPYAWKSGPGPWAFPGQLTANETPYIAVGTTSNHYAKTFTAGQAIAFGSASNNGYDGTMAASGGGPWALHCLLGMDWSQAGTNMAMANAAGQIVNNDGSGNAVFLSQANYIGSTNPYNSVTGNWYAVMLSADLLASLAYDPATKALVFNNWFAGTLAAGAPIPAFVTRDQGDGSGAAFIAFVPEPATMCLLALGVLRLASRRRA